MKISAVVKLANHEVRAALGRQGLIGKVDLLGKGKAVERYVLVTLQIISVPQHLLTQAD